MEEDIKIKISLERADIDLKIVKLMDFIETNIYDNLSKIQQSLLSVQLQAMLTYSTCLLERLDNL